METMAFVYRGSGSDRCPVAHVLHLTALRYGPSGGVNDNQAEIAKLKEEASLQEQENPYVDERGLLRRRSRLVQRRHYRLNVEALVLDIYHNKSAYSQLFVPVFCISQVDTVIVRDLVTCCRR